ncbi:MAG: hypothetical protein CMJ49_06990 [Planctomycetaceae bacterium]|nr:hypothetical protein [Planctomycetaceae bacterium]
MRSRQENQQDQRSGHAPDGSRRLVLAASLIVAAIVACLWFLPPIVTRLIITGAMDPSRLMLTAALVVSLLAVVRVRTHHEPQIRARGTRLQQFLKLVTPYRWKLAQTLVILLILAGLSLIPPKITQLIIDDALTNQDMRLFLVLLAIVFALWAVISVLGLLSGHLMRVVAGRIVFDLRKRMYDHVQKLSLGFFESRSPGEIMSRLMGDVASITTLVTGTVLHTITSVFSAVGILILLFCLDWRIALLAIGVMPLHFLSYFMFERRLSYESWKASEKNSQIQGKAHEVFDAAKMVKGYSAEQRECRALIGQLREGYEIGIRSGWLSNSWGVFTDSVSNVGTIAVMLACGLGVILMDGTAGNYIMLVMYAGALYGPIRQLINIAGQIIPARVGLMRVYEILDLEPDVIEKPNAIRRRITGEVEFERVGFAYPMSKQVLSDISFRATPGQVIALVGPSGSGKTTVANLIARFYDRTEGAIRIDGIDIADYSLHGLKSQMSVVLQETHLFRGTVRENLLYGKPDATNAEVFEAAKLANAHEFIQAMPYGYDTIVGSRGARLSGGQRQRLAIARALIRDPRLLILDEATSALDTASEMKVQEALTTLMHDRTTFIIAHRLSTIRDAHLILVLDNGRIVQRGTHDELIEKDGLFRKLYDPKWARQREKEEEEELKRLAQVA